MNVCSRWMFLTIKIELRWVENRAPPTTQLATLQAFIQQLVNRAIAMVTQQINKQIHCLQLIHHLIRLHHRDLILNVLYLFLPTYSSAQFVHTLFCLMKLNIILSCVLPNQESITMVSQCYVSHICLHVVWIFAEDVLTEDKGECVICLEELLQGDTIARLPCLCIYHKRYVIKWIIMISWLNDNNFSPLNHLLISVVLMLGLM